jgi:hypothetical protein
VCVCVVFVWVADESNPLAGNLSAMLLLVTRRTTRRSFDSFDNFSLDRLFTEAEEGV